MSAGIHPTAFIAAGAVVLGDVTLGEESSVWYGAVVRGDMAPIVIGAQSNIQDGTIVHVDEGVPCAIGRRVGVGHRVILHGCTVGDECLIGMGAILLNGVQDRHRERGGGRGGDPRGDAGAAALAGHGAPGPDRAARGRRARRADRGDVGALRGAGAGAPGGEVSAGGGGGGGVMPGASG